MKSTKDKKSFLKLLIQIVIVLISIGLFIYTILNLKTPDQGNIIDKSVTYTSATYTDTIPINLKPSPEDVVNSISEFVKIPEGGLDWKLLAKTKSVPYAYKDEQGDELYGVKPEFPTEIQKLDGQKVKLQGYMFPLNAADKQSIFMFGPFPISCPYHYHVGPALVIEANALKEIEFTLDPINIEGIIELIPRDDEYNLFYRLKDAELIH